MAKNNNLQDFLRGIADRLRELLGETALLNPQEFEQKIREVYEKGFAAGGPQGVDAKASDVRRGRVFGTGGSGKATGTAPELEAARLPASKKEQVLRAGAFLAGDQVLAAVEQSGLSASAVLAGKTVRITSGGQELWKVAGTGKSTPAQLGIKPFMGYWAYAWQREGTYDVGAAPCNGKVKLLMFITGENSNQSDIEKFWCGDSSVSGAGFYRQKEYTITATAGKHIYFRLKKHTNGQDGTGVAVFYTSVT